VCVCVYMGKDLVLRDCGVVGLGSCGGGGGDERA
jgi:hypothetical protein